MTRASVAVAALLLAAGQAQAADPLVGRWLLQSQEVAGKKADPDPLTLRIVQSGGALEFAYSLPVNNIQFVSLRFVARLDGSDADVQDADGRKIGTVKVSKGSASQYRVILQGRNRPTSYGTMTLSADLKTLVCESDSSAPNGTKIHTVQIFSRQQ
jgi:hypothetical protein